MSDGAGLAEGEERGTCLGAAASRVAGGLGALRDGWVSLASSGVTPSSPFWKRNSSGVPRHGEVKAWL